MTLPNQPTASRRRPWWQWILIGFAALFVIGFIGSLFDGDGDPAPPAAAELTTRATGPTAEPTGPGPTTEASAPTTETPEPTVDPFDPGLAREALLDHIYEANNLRTIEEVCDTEKLTEGGWWQCYYDDLEWKSASRVQINLNVPGDEDPATIGEDARRWFVNMVADYPGLEQVTTFVNGLDTGTDRL